MKIHRIGPSTERLELRAFEPRDLDVFFRLRSDPEILRYTGDPPATSKVEALEALKSYPDFEEIGYGRWGCFLKQTGEGIGFCGLKYLRELDQVDLGYRFLPEHWGHGYATESSRATVRFGFETLELSVIVGLVEPENAGSIHVLEKVGMSFVDEVEYLGSVVHRYAIRA